MGFLFKGNLVRYQTCDNKLNKQNQKQVSSKQRCMKNNDEDMCFCVCRFLDLGAASHMSLNKKFFDH